MATATDSAFAAFKHRVFTILWLATLISNIGTWMFNVTAGWLMTTLNPSPLMVSMVQAATALPIFLFALPAGALGDIFERRIILLVTQIISAFIMFIFAGMLWTKDSSAWELLLFTFLSGAGAAFSNPAWQAIVPNLVPKNNLQSAIALNGVSINVARALGPALGGFILATLGAVFAVLLNAISYVIIIIALLWWHNTKQLSDNALPREQLVGAMRAGIRFALRSTALVDTIIRALAFILFASAYWALLPLIAKDLLHGGPGLYGGLLAALGGGAILGTFLMPALKSRLSMNLIVALGTLATAAALLLFVYGGSILTGIVAGGLAGIAWLTVVSALNISVLLSLPDWVRARGLAIFQMMFFGTMTAGSILWGQVADHLGLSKTLILVALLAVLGIILTWRFKLNLDEKQDHTPSSHLPDPVVVTPIEHDNGPVLVTLEYSIADADRERFIELIKEAGITRRRDGAVQWGYFEDVTEHGRFIEVFIVESWVAHLRQHRRASQADKLLQESINKLHQGETKPRITHAVTPRPGSKVKDLPKVHYD
ncbi:enterobactin exporter EntS [Legionella massiliensis]|uniref:Enterobactin exporter EntS n=1 Tax=Legionella massiliensis TaxID=1034943 RepID=A0A078L108_9GAMM|nr:MFS transporter [Legionella massiliensis]CDZ77743.1 enterobactin exporter EntS [Legionella massiliensis]CEE13481.1 Enterobactin exporter EntS [Legionella massiliensis]